MQERDQEELLERRPKWQGHVIRTGIILVVILALYLVCVFSNIPFIKKWRTLYIETAMTTMTHQWLATMFIPQSVIDEVMDARDRELAAQAALESKWEEENEEKLEEEERLEEEANFYATYWEIESPTVKAYLSGHEALLENGYENLVVRDLDNNLHLTTVNGDDLLVIDVPNNLIIIGVKGEGYVGKLAIVKDESKIELKKSKNFGSYGQEVSSFGEDNDAILAINASRFTDIGGHGSGGKVMGSLVIDGVEYAGTRGDSTWKFCGMKADNRLYITSYPYNGVSEYKWGIEVVPALIVDGERVVNGSFGMGIQPRSCIAQARNGDFMLMIIDGRQVGYSLGCTVADCTDIFLSYGAYQAMNLDGGSSAVMWYNGEQITRSSSATGRGRYVPDAIVVRKGN